MISEANPFICSSGGTTFLNGTSRIRRQIPWVLSLKRGRAFVLIIIFAVGTASIESLCLRSNVNRSPATKAFNTDSASSSIIEDDSLVMLASLP